MYTTRPFFAFNFREALRGNWLTCPQCDPGQSALQLFGPLLSLLLSSSSSRGLCRGWEARGAGAYGRHTVLARPQGQIPYAHQPVLTACHNSEPPGRESLELIIVLNHFGLQSRP